MKHYYPKYYESFHCIAADCPDSCCRGWDVVIDSDAEDFYRTVKGDFGERLRNAIVTDSDGDRVFSLLTIKNALSGARISYAISTKSWVKRIFAQPARSFRGLGWNMRTLRNTVLRLPVPRRRG